MKALRFEDALDQAAAFGHSRICANPKSETSRRHQRTVLVPARSGIQPKRLLHRAALSSSGNSAFGGDAEFRNCSMRGGDASAFAFDPVPHEDKTKVQLGAGWQMEREERREKRGVVSGDRHRDVDIGDVPRYAFGEPAVLEEQGPQRLTDLAVLTSTEVSTLSRLIAGMKTGALLTHDVAPDSKREIVIAITPVGSRLLRELVPIAP